jgi:hypothetical protein
MRTDIRNKARRRTTACHLCGQTGTLCRDVPSGFWCQRDGLQTDPDDVIHPTPLPESVALGQDVRLKTALLEVQEAQGRFEEASAAWERAVQTHNYAKLRVAQDDGVYTVSRGWRPSRQARTTAKDLPKLEETERVARLARDVAGEQLTLARIAYRNEYEDACVRAGLPRPSANAVLSSSFVAF